MEKRGEQGERAASRYLQKKGYRILETNYRSRMGEIDIIARKGDVVAFVEVKTRSQQAWAGGRCAVDFRKQQKILKTAIQYLGFLTEELQPRFDVVEITTDDSSSKWKALHIEHIENAFTAEGNHGSF